MAYILHLLDSGSIHSAQAAEHFIAEQKRQPTAQHGKFAAFVEDITRAYPDLSAEDEDGDNDENLWEEGLDSRASYGRVKELVLKVDVTDEAVMRALIAAAGKNGLTLYDAEGQVVYPHP